MTRGLVMLSGGVDSAVALAWAQARYDELYAISFLYHLRPFRERLSVFRLLQVYPAKLLEVPVDFLREGIDLEEPLQGVPEGYISNRNVIFYSIAGYFAEIHHCEAIIGGHISGDPETFPDAAPSFFQRLSSLMNEGLQTTQIRIELPLSGNTKQEVVQKAKEWGVPLQYTWSCYWDGAEPCGKCVSCVELAQAMINQ